MTRDEAQEYCVDVWLVSNRKGTLHLSTGFGKSKVTIDILTALYEDGTLDENSKVLLLSNSEDLRDKNWKDDFEKWGKSDIYNKLDSQCYQTVYKWKDKKYDFVIADELDYALTEAYSEVFFNNSFGMVLGLTGTIFGDDKIELLNKIAPVVVKIDLNTAQSMGILNKVNAVFVKYYLSNEKNIEVPAKNQKFFTSENAQYAYYVNKVSSLMVEKSMTWIKEEKAKIDKKITFVTRNRANLLYRSSSTIKTTKQLLIKLLSKKVAVFSMYTDIADLLARNSYHSKNKQLNNLERFQNGEIRLLSICKAVDRGVNIPGLNTIVLSTFNSSKTRLHQIVGRGCRLKPEEYLTLYIMLPYYIDVKTSTVKATRQVEWAREAVKGFKFNSMEVINL